mgnify:CR=1 FL=1
MGGKERSNPCFRRAVFALSLLLLTLSLGSGHAKRGGEDQGRTFYAVESRFQGIIQSRPQSLYGEWVIGGRRYTTTDKSKFDQSDGPLLVGTCAKVRIRNWHIREIDSEPMSDCH